MDEEEDFMQPISREEAERQDDEIERELELILANPEAAVEAYPDPEMRAKILPLFRTFRKLGRR